MKFKSHKEARIYLENKGWDFIHFDEGSHTLEMMFPAGELGERVPYSNDIIELDLHYNVDKDEYEFVYILKHDHFITLRSGSYRDIHSDKFEPLRMNFFRYSLSLKYCMI